MTDADDHSNFTQFWYAVNQHLHSVGLPDLSFGPARRLWEETIAAAARDAARLA